MRSQTSWPCGRSSATAGSGRTPSLLGNRRTLGSPLPGAHAGASCPPSASIPGASPKIESTRTTMSPGQTLAAAALGSASGLLRALSKTTQYVEQTAQRGVQTGRYRPTLGGRSPACAAHSDRRRRNAHRRSPHAARQGVGLSAAVVRNYSVGTRRAGSSRMARRSVAQ